MIGPTGQLVSAPECGRTTGLRRRLPRSKMTLTLPTEVGLTELQLKRNPKQGAGLHGGVRRRETARRKFYHLVEQLLDAIGWASSQPRRWVNSVSWSRAHSRWWAWVATGTTAPGTQRWIAYSARRSKHPMAQAPCCWSTGSFRPAATRRWRSGAFWATARARPPGSLRFLCLPKPASPSGLRAERPRVSSG